MIIEHALDLEDRVDGVIETAKEAYAFGPGCKWKHFYQVPVDRIDIVKVHSHWSRTQLAAITAEEYPSISLRQVAADFGIDVSGISRLLKKRLQPCPHCGSLTRQVVKESN